jgi:hypothetical protein
MESLTEMYKLSRQSSFITRESDGALIPVAVGNKDYDAYLIWLEDGNTPTPADVPDAATVVKQGADAIQRSLDAVAQSRGYDDIKSACAYASATPIVGEASPLFERCERFRAEGNALQQWMAQTWASAYDYLEAVQQGEHPMPSPEEAVSMMPPFTWPE